MGREQPERDRQIARSPRRRKLRRLCPDGKTLASGSADKTVKIWSIATLKEQTTLQGHMIGVRALVFAPVGKLLASVSGERDVDQKGELILGD
jgi:WD40 repeat protein